MSEFHAYESDKSDVETVMRMHSVKRWHMIDTTRQQTLAEHSANVALLTLLIARTSPRNSGHSMDTELYFPSTEDAVVAALVHDLPEAFTGDLPSHTKKHLHGVKELEDRLTSPIFAAPVNDHTKLLVKLCDLADGIRFIRLHGVDLTASHAQRGLEEQLANKYQEAAVKHKWPSHILNHVKGILTFYAYENS